MKTSIRNITSDAHQTPGRRNVSKSGIRGKISKSCVRCYFLFSAMGYSWNNRHWNGNHEIATSSSLSVIVSETVMTISPQLVPRPAFVITPHLVCTEVKQPTSFFALRFASCHALFSTAGVVRSLKSWIICLTGVNFYEYQCYSGYRSYFAFWCILIFTSKWFIIDREAREKKNAFLVDFRFMYS